jgi:DNA primase
MRNEAEHLVLDFRKNFIEDKLVSLKAEISKSMGDNEKLRSLMQEYAEAQKIRNELARKLGNDIVS